MHLPNGIRVTEGGFEYNAVLIAAVTLLAESGPGPASLDRALGIEKKGVLWGLAVLAGGALASPAVLSRAARSEPADLAEHLSDEASKAAAGIGLG